MTFIPFWTLSKRQPALTFTRSGVPPDDLHPEVSGGNYLEGTTDYSGRTVIERSRFAQKVDAVLGYFQFIQGKPKKDIGFQKP